MRKRQRAFALVELLVVIAVIAWSIAILIPATQRVKKQSKGVICLSNLKQWGSIFAMYTYDNDGFFPRRASGSGRWINVLYDYYSRNEKIRICPAATRIANPEELLGVSIDGDKFTSWGRLYVLDVHPGDKRYPLVGAYGSYGINGWVYVPGTPTVYGKPADDFWMTPKVKGASDIPLFLDCWFWCGWPDNYDTPPSFDGEPGPSNIDFMNGFCINRHQQKINGIFLDYSVREIGLKELWTLKWHRSSNTAGPYTRAGGARAEDWPEWMRNFKEY
jgi:prepilin-type N-terminal cleavage/methylation domain-containing protein